MAVVDAPSGRGVLNLWLGDLIPSVGKIEKIEPFRIILRSKQTGECEFLAKNDGDRYSPPPFRVLPKGQGSKVLSRLESKKGIVNEDNKFKIKRSYLQENLQNIMGLANQIQVVKIKKPDGTTCL